MSDTMNPQPKYHRVLLKVSGEALHGHKEFGFDIEAIKFIAEEIKSVVELGVQIGVVIGGGNILRGWQASDQGMDRVLADQMGMLATVINAIALQNCIERLGTDCRIQSAVFINNIVEPFNARQAVEHLEEGRILIFAGGTGNPFFTTDTAATLRASEIGADIIFKATKVEGVYDTDPVKNPNAKLYKSITHIEAVKERLKVMDITALTLSMDNKIPIRVFKLMDKGNLKRAVLGEDIGTMVQS